MIADDICRVFCWCFRDKFKTELVGGASEPLYVPASRTRPLHRIFFREDFASSALHESAHWCIAGIARRRQQDFGYWYDPDRTRDRQLEFETLETRPQALEWIFSVAAGIPFRVSCDNFDERSVDTDRFRVEVQRAAHTWLDRGLPDRARTFAHALAAEKGCADPCERSNYKELPG